MVNHLISSHLISRTQLRVAVTFEMPCHSVGFRRVRWSSGSPNLQGFPFMRVRLSSLQFGIFSDGNADIYRRESLWRDVFRSRVPNSRFLECQPQLEDQAIASIWSSPFSR